MGQTTNHYPPGPCGQCGKPDTVDVIITKEWVQPAHEEGYYLEPIIDGVCESCDITADKTNLIEVYGGRPGYAVGFDGNNIQSAMSQNGWLNIIAFQFENNNA